MSFLSSIAKPLSIGIGAAALGSLLFPQTTSMLTGGLLGSDTGTGLLSGLGATGAGQSSSIWTNPTVLSSGILAGTSLLSGLFGSSAEDAAADLAQQRLDEEKRQFDAQLALKQADLAQALEIAKIQASASRAGSNGASIAAAAALKQAKANALGQAAQNKMTALQIPLAAIANQSAAAQTAGAQSGSFFNGLIPSLQRPALRGG